MAGVPEAGTRPGEGGGAAADPGGPGFTGAARGTGRGTRALPAAGGAALPGMAEGQTGGGRNLHATTALVAGRDRETHRDQYLDQPGRFEFFRIPAAWRRVGSKENIWTAT